jgi:hypothetical protein
VNGKKVTPGEITIMAAGAVALIFSFLDFYGGPDIPETELPNGETIGGGGGFSLWSSGLLPVGTLMVIFCVVMALHIALTKFTTVNVPERVAGLTWTQIHLVLGFFAALYAVAFLLTEGGEKEIGFWLVFLACIAAFAGAILLRKEREGASPAPPAPPAPPPT